MPLIHKEVSPFGDWIIYMNGVPLYKKWPTGRSILFDKFGPPISNTDRDAMPHGESASTPEASAMEEISKQEPSAFVKMVVSLLSARSSDAAFIERTTRLFVVAADLLHWKDFSNHEVFTLTNLRDNLDMGALIEAINFSRYPTIPCEVYTPISDYLKSIPGYRPDMGLKQSKDVIRCHTKSEYEITKLLATLDDDQRDFASQPLAVPDAYPDGGAKWTNYLLHGNFSPDQPASDAVPNKQEPEAVNPFQNHDDDTLARMIAGLLADNSSNEMLIGRATHLFVVAVRAVQWKHDENLIEFGIHAIRDHLNLRTVIDLGDPSIYPTMPHEVRHYAQEYLRTLPQYRPDMAYKQSQTTYDEHGCAEMELTKLLGSLHDTYSYLFDHSPIEESTDPFWIPKRLKLLEEARAADPVPDDIVQIAANLDYLRGGPSSLDIADAIYAERKRWQEEIERLRKAADYIAPYLRWTISDESPGYNPTMPSAVAAFHVAFDIDTAEKRIARLKASTKLTSEET